MRQPLTIAILTKNEELLIERAIRSCAWADEVLVLDSGSTDRTCEIAVRECSNDKPVYDGPM